jgi:hypothetical protein
MARNKVCVIGAMELTVHDDEMNWRDPEGLGRGIIGGFIICNYHTYKVSKSHGYYY